MPSPNTDFTVGQLYTSVIANQFPRGVMSYTETTTSTAAIGTTETVILTGASFTAVANRLYKVTFFEPQNFTSSGAPALANMRIRQTNLTGTVKQQVLRSMVGLNTQDNYIIGQYIGTLSAGSTNFVLTAASTTSATTMTFARSASQVAFLLVEDIGLS